MTNMPYSDITMWSIWVVLPDDVRRSRLLITRYLSLGSLPRICATRCSPIRPFEERSQTAKEMRAAIMMISVSISASYPFHPQDGERVALVVGAVAAERLDARPLV